jgi:hypothetical protein
MGNFLDNFCFSNKKIKIFSKINKKYNPDVIPTKMPDGTTLLGVIYDSGKFDLLFYEDGIWGLVGSRNDSWVTAQPYGIDVSHGSINTLYPALGTVKRPEALRLESLLAVSRDVAYKIQMDAFNDPNHKGEQSKVRPGIWKHEDIVEIVLSKNYIIGAPMIMISTIHNNIYAAPILNNDMSYVAKLLDISYPGVWRYGTNREIRSRMKGIKRI